MRKETWGEKMDRVRFIWNVSTERRMTALRTKNWKPKWITVVDTRTMIAYSGWSGVLHYDVCKFTE